jgi:hypothetical protein
LPKRTGTLVLSYSTGRAQAKTDELEISVFVEDE